MTYMFLMIAIGLLMAVGPSARLPGLVGLTLVFSTRVLESNLLARRELAQEISYDNVALISRRDRGALIADLRRRTGQQVHRVDIRYIDLLRDSTRVIAYSYEDDLAEHDEASEAGGEPRDGSLRLPMAFRP